MDKVTKKNAIILADSTNHYPNRKAQVTGAKFITRMLNIIRKTSIKNALCNVQAIPAKYLNHYDIIHGDSSFFFINEHFIIKDEELNTANVNINTNTASDVPNSIYVYAKYAFVIAWVFIKFMLSSFSAFLLDFGLSLLAFNVYAKYIVDFFSQFTSNPLFLDTAIVSTAGAG